MSDLRNDIRFASRALRKSPVFTIVAVVSLALGIGANTAIFTLLDQVLLRLLPVKDPQQLVLLSMRGFHYGGNWGGNAISYPMYHDFSEHNSVFSGMFCRFPYRMALSFEGRTERVAGELVSGTYFPLLGVGAAVGRTFTPDDDRTPGGHPVAMLTYSYWKARFAGDPSVIGKSLVLNAHNYTVIGVAQQGFDGVEFGNTAQVFVPLMMQPQVIPDWDPTPLKNRRQRWVNAFGRLKPGVTAQQAEASIQPFFHGMLEMEVKEADFRNASAQVRERFLKNVIVALPGSQGRSYLRRQLTTPLWVLMAITGGVLLIACANVASLLVAKAASRQKEIAIRFALGAGRARIMKQLLVESLLLSGIGGVFGLLLAILMVRLLMGWLPPDTASLAISTTPDLRILLFTIGVSVLTGIIFGLAPAMQTTKTDVAPTLKDQVGGIVGASGAGVRLRKTLVTAQVTLSLLLLVGAGLFIRSLRNLRDLGPGFPSENLVALNVDPSLNGYDAARAKAFYHRLTDEINAVPGVRSVGLASMRILEDNEWDNWVTVEGYTASKPGEFPSPYMNSISPGYFATLGVPFLAGRDFTTKDTEMVQHGTKPTDTVPRVVLVNEKFAKRFFGSARKRDRTARWVRSRPGYQDRYGSRGRLQGHQVHQPAGPDSHSDVRSIPCGQECGRHDHLRTDDDECRPVFLGGAGEGAEPGRQPSAVRDAHDRRPDLEFAADRAADCEPLDGVRVAGHAARDHRTLRRHGLHRRAANARDRHSHGAGRVSEDVIWMVMREVLVLVGIGIVVGLAAAAGLTRFIETQLYGLTGHDPATLVLATLGLAAIACAAGYIPAIRASRVDAMQALRYE